MRIWIDLANSPHVLFFRPIIAELHRRGHDTIITSRHFAQTKTLADHFELDHTPIGGHAGSQGLSASLMVNLQRARLQLKHLAGQSIDLAVSHNAYAQAIAARWQRIPLVTAMDYEHQRGNHLPFRVARLVIVPEAFPDASLKRYGARQTFKYAGLKEQIYLSDFVADPTYRNQFDIPEDKILVLLRPPATWALYHKGVENELFYQILQDLGQRQDVFMVCLVRIPDQRGAIEALNLTNIWIPDEALDGPNLIAASDLVISAGGTMNREAAVLGVPVYTVFAGLLGGVDHALIQQNRLKVLEVVIQLHIKKRDRSKTTMLSKGTALVDQITDAILSVGLKR